MKKTGNEESSIPADWQREAAAGCKQLSGGGM